MVAINQVDKKEPYVAGVNKGAKDGRSIVFHDKDGTAMTRKRTFSRSLVDEFSGIYDRLNTNRVRVIDTMVYASDALCAAAWVGADVAATTGVIVTRDTSDKLNGASNVEFTVGSAFASATNVVKTLTADRTTYPEDRLGRGYQNWDPYNYIIIPRHAEQALAATDIDVILTDWQDVTSVYSLPAIVANNADVWGTYAVAFSSFTDGTGFDWRYIKSMTLQFNGATMGNDEAMSIGEIVLCKYCSGFVPAMGTLVPVVLGSDSMVEGMQLKLGGASLLPIVTAGGDGDEEVVGVLCGSGDTGDVALMQIDGLIVGELGALTSLEVGDYVAGAASGGLTWTESANTGADAIGTYIVPFVDAAAQYTLVWIKLGTGGGVPS